MKKLGGLLIILTILLSSFILAQSNSSSTTSTSSSSSSEGIDKAYQCLEDLIEDKEQADLSLQEAIFSTLALGSDSKLIGKIENEKSSSAACWPKSSCTVKETAQVLLAYKRVGKDTKAIENWLLTKNVTAKDLTWYLEMDITNHVESSCTLQYQGTTKTITINEDMTISGSPGQCFSISSSGFWLKINNNCIGEEFRISCDEDFVTSLLYQRLGSPTIFVSPEAHSASALGTTEEKVVSQCFGTTTACDYEGTLWASLAFDKANRETSSFLPYLLALSSENVKFFPSTFLYILTQGTDQYSEVVQAQQQSKYWQAPNTPYNRFYDSSLAMLALQGTSAQELGNAQAYFLSIQTPEGCWNNNNIRDTAFVLYSGWSKSISGTASGSSLPQSCVSAGYECTSSLFSCSEAGGSALDFDCDFGICCSASLAPAPCEVQRGLICSSTQECSGTVVNALEGSCCLGACQEVSQSSACELAGGSCFSSCTSGEEQTSDSCASGVCCMAKESSSFSWTLVIILIILIALAVLAILYRKQIQLAIFKLKNRRRPPSSAAPSGPKFPPPYGPSAMRRPMSSSYRPSPSAAPQQPARKAQSKEDKEFEETLRKLKEMSK